MCVGAASMHMHFYLFFVCLLQAGPVRPVLASSFFNFFFYFMTDVLDLRCLCVCVNGEGQSSLMHKQIIPQPRGGCNMIRILLS